MYWLNMRKLAVDLREGRVDEKERFKYYLATFIAWNLIVQVFFHFGGPFHLERLIPAALNLSVTILGIFVCYSINKKGDNKDFIGRMICLGWPIGMWVIIGSVSLFLFMLVAFLPLGGGNPYSLVIGRLLRWNLWIFIFQYYIGLSGFLIEVSQAGEDPLIKRILTRLN